MLQGKSLVDWKIHLNFTFHRMKKGSLLKNLFLYYLIGAIVLLLGAMVDIYEWRWIFDVRVCKSWVCTKLPSYVSLIHFNSTCFWQFLVVMGQTQFYRTSNKLEHYFSNIERTQMCSSIGDRTQTPYFWFRTIEHQTSNLIGRSLYLLNYSSNWLKHHFYEHWTNSNVFIYW